jgi:peptidoglycan/LPS O-acetylase OafA/YrhL|tara:strand:- start:756 stop:2621 length:1866 start_codon:yes stop_codon:yes gene_type:complete
MNSQNIIGEIQFLRAVSVVLVILFHFDLFGFKGGFIGVDIFFTISGFLITSILLKEKKFSFLEFYFKRAKRILPTLYLVIVASIVLGYFILSPLHFERLIDSSKFSLLALSNYFFYQETGYFDHDKLFKPLLHTWSLAVEIQYYIIWPIIIISIKKIFGKNLLAPISFILILSIVASYIYTERVDGFFYFTGLRLYEFCIGSLCFLILQKKKLKNETFFIAGLLLIFYCAIFYNSNLKIPGLYSLLPCLGAAFVILFKIPDGILLIKKNIFFNYTAKISYTLYLIHWPLLIFYTYQKGDALNIGEKAILIFITYILSMIVYEFYEKKIRYPFKSKEKEIYFILIIFLPSVIFFNPLSSKLENKKILKKFNESSIIGKVFEGRKVKEKIENEIFIKIKEDNYFINNPLKKNIIVLGDSHAFDFFLAIESNKNTKKNNNYFYQNFEYLYCFRKEIVQDKIINYLNYNILKRKNSCEIALKGFKKHYLKKAHTLVLSNKWSANIDYEKVINYFYEINKNLILVSNGHRFYDVPTLFFNKAEKVNIFAKNLYSVNEINMTEIIDLSKKLNFKFFDKSKINCNPNCTVLIDDILLYSDEDHWSYAGMEYFGKKLEELKFFSLIKSF